MNMSIQGDLVVMQLSDLQKIIEEAIKERDTDDTTLTSHNLFKELRSEANAEIIRLNKLFGISSYGVRGVQDAIFTKFPSRKGPVLASTICENTRQLTLSILGANLNQELKREDYDLARDIYRNISDLANEAYKERLEQYFETN